MHQHDGAAEGRGVGRGLVLHIGEVGHGSHVVVLHGVGVEGDELDAVEDETEVLGPEHPFVGLVARAQEVVVADEGKIGLGELAQLAPCPHKLLGGARLGEVAQMDYEVDAVAAVDIVYLVAQVGIVAVGVRDDRKAHGVSPLAGRLDLGDVGGIDVALATEVHVVGMYVEDVLAAREHHDEHREQCGPHRADAPWGERRYVEK